MSPVRELLLWASQNHTLRRVVPRLGFVRRALRQFMPGESLDDALRAADDLRGHGLQVTMSILGENVTSLDAADRYAEAFTHVYERSAHLGAEISLKLTHLGLDLDPARAAKHVDALAGVAAGHDTWLWIDMESSEYVDVTLDIYREVSRAHDNVGVCLQAYLHRTPDDVASLLPLRPGIRLVKGAYREPSDVAVQGRKAVDMAFFEIGAGLLMAARDGDARVAFGTHDLELMERLDVVGRIADVPTDAYEIQMLYGIRSADQRRLAAERPVRVIVAYGTEWYPWYVRRLAERPANLWFVLRNLVAAPPPH